MPDGQQCFKHSSSVALKIMLAKALTSINTDLSIYSLLAEKARDGHLAQPVAMLLISFERTGPDEIHKCLVFEHLDAKEAIMGSSMARMGA